MGRIMPARLPRKQKEKVLSYGRTRTKLFLLPKEAKFLFQERHLFTLIAILPDFLLSLTIGIGSKVVGSLVVSSLVVLPTAIALQLKKGYKWTRIFSVFFSIVSRLIRLILAYYLDLKPGTTIVRTSIAFLLVMFAIKQTTSLIKKKKLRK